MKQELRFGVIGTGGRGSLARYAHDPEHGSRIVAGADVREEALEDFRNRYGDVYTSSDYREVVDRGDVDAVFVTSPDYLHEEHATAALLAGKDVYLEKPMAITIEGCDRILETARSAGRRLFLGHNMRHFPVILKMKELIDAGTIGEIKAAWCRHFVSYGGDAYFRDWHSERRYATGLLLQKGAHDIDVIHWLAGGYSTRVTAFGSLSVYGSCARRTGEQRGDPTFRPERWPPETQTGFSPVIDVEDQTMLLMQLDNGVQASYLQCHFTPDAWRNYTFIGTRGRIENLGDSGEARIEVYTNRSDSFLKPDEVHYLRPIGGSHGGADPAIVQRFIEYIRDGRKPNTSPIAARNAVAAGYMGTVSLRNGGVPETVPPVPGNLLKHFEPR